MVPPCKPYLKWANHLLPLHYPILPCATCRAMGLACMFAGYNFWYDFISSSSSFYISNNTSFSPWGDVKIFIPCMHPFNELQEFLWYF
ncbi:hypothetical protein QL285_093283 [Trifolium repens]|nr:hypothetical protein QL285_093283 [Trifolium repens]